MCPSCGSREFSNSPVSPATPQSTASVSSPPEITVSPGAQKAPRSSSYLLAHWRGELSLARSFWINGILLNFVIGFASAIFSDAISGHLRPNFSFVAFMFAIAVVLLSIPVWQLVGIWRSAGSHTNRTGHRFWAIVARFMVILNCMGLIAVMISYAILMKQAIQIATGEKLSEYDISLAGDTDIHLTGYINFDALDDVRRILSSNEKVSVLILNSPGGLIGAAIDLGHVVDEHQLTVVADGQCLSACTLPLVASPNSTVIPGALIGFHRAGGTGVLGADEQVVGRMDRFFADHGVDPSTRRIIRSTDYEDMWVPSLDELVNRGLVSYVFDTEAREYVKAAEWCTTHPLICAGRSGGVDN